MEALENEGIDAREKRWLLGVIALQLLAITLPYLWAWAITPPGYQFQGLHYSIEDQNVHLAWARQAYERHFFIRDLFTHETLTSGEPPLFNNLFTWFIGTLTRLTHLPMIFVYHGLRLLCAALTFVWFYALCAQLTDDRRVRLLALVLAAFSGGAGWLGLLFPKLLKGRAFMDRPDTVFMMPEAFTFTSVFVFALFAVSMALLSFVYCGVLRAQEKDDWRQKSFRHPIIGAGCAAFLLSNIHTYDALPLNAVLLTWAVLSWRNARRTTAWLAPLIIMTCSWPPVIYQLFVFANSTEFRLKALMRTLPPPLWDVLLSYGVLALLAIAGAWALRRDEKARLMILWAALTMAMIYAPLSFGRKMIEGAHLPLCFLAAAGLVSLASRIPAASARRATIGAVVTICCLSSVYFTYWCLKNAKENNYPRVQAYSMTPLYLAQSDVAALEYLEQLPRGETSTQTAILALPMLSNYIPRYTGRVVFGGHPAETLHYYDIKTGKGKWLDVQRFFGLRARMSTPEARSWLQRNRIGLVVMGEYEWKMGASIPVPMKVLKQFPGGAGRPDTIILDATSAYPNASG